MATVVTRPESIGTFGKARSTVQGTPLSPDELRLLDHSWRATLYLALGMIYLKGNMSWHSDRFLN
jgi:xylulose-5-phosphate/fructose-6-phosphate phosphoketolase